MQLHFTVNLSHDDLSLAIDAMTKIRSATFDAKAPVAAAPATSADAKPAAEAKPASKPRKPAASASPANDRKTLEALAAPMIQAGRINEIREKLAELGANPPKLDNLPVAKYDEFAAALEVMNQPDNGGGSNDSLDI